MRVSIRVCGRRCGQMIPRATWEFFSVRYPQPPVVRRRVAQVRRLAATNSAPPMTGGRRNSPPTSARSTAPAFVPSAIQR